MWQQRALTLVVPLLQAGGSALHQVVSSSSGDAVVHLSSKAGSHPSSRMPEEDKKPVSFSMLWLYIPKRFAKFSDLNDYSIVYTENLTSIHQTLFGEGSKTLVTESIKE